MPMSPFGPVPLTPTAFLSRARAVHRDRLALVDGQVRRTYEELAQRCERLAGALAGLGVTPGDRVSVLAPNTGLALEAHFGVPWAGAVLNALNTRLSAGELAYIVGHAGSKVLLVDTDLAELGRQVLAELGGDVRLVVAGGADDELEALLEGAPPLQVAVEDELSLLSINYTSGTTGRPKGVMYSHRGAYLQALAMVSQTGLDARSTYLWTLPMFHCNGWCFPWTLALQAGASVCLRKVDPALIFSLVREHRVTHLCGAPIVYGLLINAPQVLRSGISHPIAGLIAGAAPPAAIIEGCERIGIDITHVYGLTEVYGPAAVCAKQAGWDQLPIGERAALNARQGVAYPMQQSITVLNPETMRPVPADGETMGEIFFRGNLVMKGYLKNPQATAEAFAGGWFHTGDLAVIHPDGYVKIKDRSKDVIISGGENISSLEVEEVLYRHPAVLVAAVVAKPDDKWGEVPCAYLELCEGASVTEAEIIQHCRAQLARFKVPKQVLFGALPKTSTGKIQKFVLREQLRSASAME